MLARLTGSSLQIAIFLEDHGIGRENAYCMIDEVQCEADSLGTSYAKTFRSGSVKLTAWGDSNKYSATITGELQCACGHAFTDHSFYGATRIECHGKDTEPETMSCECGEYRPVS